MGTLSPSDEERVKRYEEILAKEPSAIIFAVLGSLYARKYEFDKAINVLSGGVKNYPNYFSARILLSKCYLAKGNTDGAVRELQNILALDPYNVPALIILGDVTRDARRYADAERCYRKVLEIDPDNTDVQYKLHLLSQLTEPEISPEPTVFEKAEVSDERAAISGEPEGVATITLAEVYAEQGLLDKAASILRRLLKENPDDERVLKAHAEIQSLIESDIKLHGESVVTIVDQVSAVKGLMGDDEFEIWYDAQRSVAETIRGAGVSFSALFSPDQSFSTAGETVLTIGPVNPEPRVSEVDILEVDPALAELLMIEFELEDAPAALSGTGLDEFVFDDSEPREKTGVSVETVDFADGTEPVDDSGPNVGIGPIITGTETVEEEETTGRADFADDGETTDVSERVRPSRESVVKPEMYIPREIKELEQDPFGDDDEFLGWLNSIRLRDL
jgi:tetratricopeptide (TPR) repeat protein